VSGEQGGARRRRVKLAGWNSGVAVTLPSDKHEGVRCARAPKSFPYFPRQWRYPARAQAHWKFDLTGCARSALESQLESVLQRRGEARVHRFERFPAPGAEFRIPRVDAVIVDEEIIGDGESHGRAAWRSGADKSITRGQRYEG